MTAYTQQDNQRTGQQDADQLTASKDDLDREYNDGADGRRALSRCPRGPAHGAQRASTGPRAGDSGRAALACRLPQWRLQRRGPAARTGEGGGLTDGPEPLDTGHYHARLDALRVYVGARDAETASPGPETEASADAAYERYAVRDQDGPAPSART